MSASTVTMEELELERAELLPRPAGRSAAAVSYLTPPRLQLASRRSRHGNPAQSGS